MSITPRADILPNTEEFETLPLVAPQGFREYDARWWFGTPAGIGSGTEKAPELNLLGVQVLGAGLGTLIHEKGVEPKIVVGHDFRGYSLAIKQALTVGLMNAGCQVHDIGLALSPTAYFAQFHLDCPAVAMVTASHNENGWTGVKMGADRPLTFGPDEMSRLKEIVLGGLHQTRSGGSYQFVPGVKQAYVDDLVASAPKLTRTIKAVAACGNGTAGAFVPEILKRVGVELIELDTNLDFTFPKYNPNPEDMEMLGVLKAAVREHGADVGFAFDGDGDRCGVVDNEGEEIFADKIGVMLARDLSAKYPNSKFVVDVKSTGIFAMDPVLKANGATTDYYKTGHSYIKRRTKELGALAGFEKSGHFFLQPPVGRGYDDGAVAAIAVLRMMENAPDQTVADMRRALPLTYSSPTMSPKCADDLKYGVVEEITNDFLAQKERGDTILGQRIVDIITVNGVRVVLEDGTWGLVRASSNKPTLVVVVESPVSRENMVGMFHDIEARLQARPEVGEFDQKLEAEPVSA